MHRLGTILMLAVPAAAAVGQPLTTLRFDMPENIGVHGLQWTQDYLVEPIDGMIVGARLVVNFDTDRGIPFHDAADILFQHQLPTDPVPFWNVRGSDLGWSGTGQFAGAISTDAFNGQRLLYDPGALFVFWFGRIVSDNEVNQALGGMLTDSYWEFDIRVVPAPGSLGVVGSAMLLAARRRR